VNYKVFIDTNIFLDFYRIRRENVSSQYLSLIDKHKDKIITTYQVEMEYKKNRQVVILESIKNSKMPDFNTFAPPILLYQSEPVKIIIDSKKTILKKEKELKSRFYNILKNPVSNDLAYQTFQRLFKSENEFNLTRKTEEKNLIKELALKRFLLGYPPRKKDDTSFGDSYNWEWLIHCANKYKIDVIIVSRDSDYGVKIDDGCILNDWLNQEFKDRVSKKRKIILTDKLSDAFKLISEKVTKEMENEEKEIIETRLTESNLIIDNVLLNNKNNLKKAINDLKEELNKYRIHTE